MNLATGCVHAGTIAEHALLAHHTAVLATCQLAWYLTLLPYYSDAAYNSHNSHKPKGLAQTPSIKAKATTKHASAYCCGQRTSSHAVGVPLMQCQCCMLGRAVVAPQCLIILVKCHSATVYELSALRS